MEIQSYQFGRIEIDGRAYCSDVKILVDEIVPEWWRAQGHFVETKDVEDILSAEADVCLFGTGAYGSMRISDAVKTALENRGVQVVIEKTAAACDRFNRLRKEGKRIVAGFHLTC